MTLSISQFSFLPSRFLLRVAVSLFLLFIPSGYLVADVLALEQDRDLLSRLALWAGLSMSLVPLALLWLTMARIPVTALLVRVTLLGISVLVLWRWLVRRRRSERRIRVNELTRPHYLVTSTVVLILLLSASLRFLPPSELALPSWIDSVHHVVVTRLILERGGVPDSYQPFLPVSPFLYHFGFHALSAVFVWLAGVDPASAVLIVGQTLSFLAPLTVYWLALRLTGMRWAGVISALVVGTVSLMPAHFVNWGRYTHLAGMSLLPAAVVLAMDVLEQDACRRASILAAAVVLAGLTLTHYRVLVFALAYLVVYLFISILGEITSQLVDGSTRGHYHLITSSPRHLIALLPCCLIILLLASPWLIRLASATLRSDGIWSGLTVDASYNAFPHDLLLATANRPVAVLAVWGWLLALWRRHNALVAMGLWVPVLFLAANSQIVGLRTSPLITNSSVVISLYLPLSVLVGYLVAEVIAEIEKRIDDRWHRHCRFALATVVILVALWGARSLWPVITPETVLADEEDLLALSWIEENTPAEAKFLISARRWQANIYVGTDGGYWIPALTDRQTTVPPALYVQGSPEYVARINALAEITTEGPDVDESSFRQILAREGVTHVYLGARGSLLPRQALLESNHYALVYASGNVWIFEVLSGDEG